MVARVKNPGYLTPLSRLGRPRPVHFPRAALRPRRLSVRVCLVNERVTPGQASYEWLSLSHGGFALCPGGNGKPPKNFKEENYVIQIYISEMSLWPPQGNGGLSEIGEAEPGAGNPGRRPLKSSRHHTLERPQGRRGQEPSQRAP